MLRRLGATALAATLALFAIFGHSQAATTVQEYQLTSADGTILPVQRYPTAGDTLALWLTSGFGAEQRTNLIAEQLAAKHIEVWQIDLADALFLPNGAEQMRTINAGYVMELLQLAHQETDKKILAIAGSYNAIPLLRGIRLWQSQTPATPYLIGALLLSPNLYATLPSLGLAPEYVPVVKATNIPLVIYQDERRGNRWFLEQLVAALKVGGSAPILHVMPGVSGLLFSGDATPETLQAVNEMPDNIIASIDVLAKQNLPLTAAPMPNSYLPMGSGVDDRLKNFRGKFAPHPIDLVQLSGARYRRTDYRGQVTLVNFWATWCPPCVQEIPSLNRLKAAMADLPFEVISINYAEQAASISEFMHQVQVDFPVLLDTTGEFAAAWKVVAFPSTYVIGPDGDIHYGVNAAIHWDDPEVINKIKALLQNPPLK